MSESHHPEKCDNPYYAPGSSMGTAEKVPSEMLCASGESCEGCCFPEVVLCTFAGKVSDPSQIREGEWGTLWGRPLFRPPGTPRALPLSLEHKITFRNSLPTVMPSIHYDPGGPWEWHGWVTDGKWVGA